MRVRFIAFAAAAAVAVASGAFAGDAAKAPSPHPHFNDKGTLSWSKKLADAQVAAKASDKLIFIEYGRET